METVAEEKPLRSATSRMVTAEDWERLRGSDARLDADFAADFAVPETVREGFESPDSMDSLYFGLLLADTTAR